jgi:hypothetical protein
MAKASSRLLKGRLIQRLPVISKAVHMETMDILKQMLTMGMVIMMKGWAAHMPTIGGGLLMARRLQKQIEAQQGQFNQVIL